MNNKRVLQTAIKELDKRKAPPAPKDIITDPAGQWKFPGQVTRIPSNNITMQGVNYPVLGVPDIGEPTMMQPGGYYNFPDANYVDEYPQMKKGGGLKSKKYTNNIMGTSYLFAQSDAFKKPKKMSKKRIFNPNAKYYQDGGLMTQEEIDGATEGMMKARLAYEYMHGNPAAQRMVVAPDQPYVFDHGDTGTHFMASMDNYAVPLIQDVNGQLMLGDFGPESAEAMKFDNPEDAMYFAEHYKDVSPAFIEADLTPEEIQEYAKGGYVIEELDGYAEGGDPGDVQCPPGYVYNPETKYCEKKSGCPEGYTFDSKSGRCVSKYEKESVKVYTGPYKYGPDGRKITDPTRYDISELREATPDELITATQREQQLWPEDNFNWPSDYTVKEILNPAYFLPSQTNWIDVNGTPHPFDVYPDLNYKVVVDPKKPEGFNKDENIYYVKSENTHQFKKYKEWELLKQQEKDTIAEAEKRGYTIKPGEPEKRTILPYDTYKQNIDKTEIDPSTGEEYTYSSEEFLPGWDEKSFRDQQKLVSELYKDPEYLGYDAYNKSFDEFYKDRPQLNKQQWREQCKDCTYNHGYSFQIDPDYIYRSYNPNQNKVGPTGSINRVIATLENEYADPNIVQQMPTIEEYPYPEGPGYNPVGYKGIGIHPTWGYDKKSKTHIGLHPGKRNSGEGRFYKYDTWEDDRDFRGFGQHDRTKLLPFIVQKSTGYNPQQMEGYFNEENEWVPGEYERAQEEGRKINFQGAASLKDLRNQKQYLSEYDEYMKEKGKVDEMNQQLREEWLPPLEYAGEYAEGGAPCPPGYVKINGKCVSLNKKATAEDSLAIYKNAVALKNFYKTNNYKAKQLPLPVHPWEDVENARNQVLNERNSSDFNFRTLKPNEYYQKVDDYKFKQRDLPILNSKNLGLGILNTNAPMALYDARIKPNLFTKYEHQGDKKAAIRYFKYGKKEDFIKGHQDVAGVFSYDPISIKPSNLLTVKEVKERYKKYGPSGISKSKLQEAGIIPKDTPKTNPKPKVHQYPTEYKPVVNNIPQTVPEGKKIVGQEEVQQLDPKTGKVTTVINPIYETVIPPTVNPELQKFVEEKKPEPPGPPPGTGTDVMPVYNIDELPMYATPDPDAEWVGKTERYIDWDGNSVGYNLPRVRKPGHGGDLIRKGKRRYLHFPSIESRYQAEIVPEEEYAMGGEYNEGDEVELTEAEVKRLRSLGYIIEEA